MRRLFEIIVGVVLIGYSAHAIYTGHVRGSWRAYRRSEEPWKFWYIVLICSGIGLAFLLGAVSWRE